MQMAAAFQPLRTYDLLWLPLVDTYVRGKRAQLNDLMSWNADATRMPWRMHQEYLRRLYLENELDPWALRGRGCADQHERRFRFRFSTSAPRRTTSRPGEAVYKTRAYTRSSDFTFLLTSGGHNAGIVSGPQNAKRRYRMSTWRDAATFPARMNGSADAADSWLLVAGLAAVAGRSFIERAGEPSWAMGIAPKVTDALMDAPGPVRAPEYRSCSHWSRPERGLALLKKDALHSRNTAMVRMKGHLRGPLTDK